LQEGRNRFPPLIRGEIKRGVKITENLKRKRKIEKGR
jgi:hypothetical protein